MELSKTKIKRIAFFFGLIWIETDDGSFHYRILDHGETLSAVADGYEQRGQIDDKCNPFSAINREPLATDRQS